MRIAPFVFVVLLGRVCFGDGSVLSGVVGLVLAAPSKKSLEVLVKSYPTVETRFKLHLLGESGCGALADGPIKTNQTLFRVPKESLFSLSFIKNEPFLRGFTVRPPLPLRITTNIADAGLEQGLALGASHLVACSRTIQSEESSSRILW